MASTVTRTTWNDDSGIPSAPVGDGTTINNARLQDIYDAIDALFSGSLLAGGTIGAEGLGTHALSAGGTGGNILLVRNTSAGTGNLARVQVQADSTTVGLFEHHSTTFTTGGASIQDGTAIRSTGTGGIAIAALNSGAGIGFYTGGNNLRLQIGSGGHIGFGTAASTAIGYAFTVAPSAGSGAKTGLSLAQTFTANVGEVAMGARIAPSITEAASGTHGWVRTLSLEGELHQAAGSTTNAAQLYIESALGIGGVATNAYAIYVADGTSAFNGRVRVLVDGTAAEPAVAGSSNSSGLFFVSGGASGIGIATQGLEIARFVGTGVTPRRVTVPSSANTAGESGNYILLGQNSSGSGAPGAVTMTARNGTNYTIFPDTSGNLRIKSGFAPTETEGDTGGTVVGTQTSTRETKTDIQPFEAHEDALALILRTPLRTFRYRSGAFGDDQFLGIIADEAPAFVMDQGRVFNPINAFGYTAGAIKALAARVAALEARG